MRRSVRAATRASILGTHHMMTTAAMKRPGRVARAT
jgi:hypothetical protein